MPNSLTATRRKRPRLNVRAVIRRLIARDDTYCHYCHCRLLTPDVLRGIRGGNAPDGRRTRNSILALGQGARMATIDHKVPVIKGGTNCLDNLVLACPTCNYAKRARPYHEFRMQRIAERLGATYVH